MRPQTVDRTDVLPPRAGYNDSDGHRGEGVVITAGSASVGTTTARADSSCADGHVCFWVGYDFQGDKASRGEDAPKQQWIPIEGDDPVTRGSVKNHFGRRRIFWTGVDGPVIDPTHCVGPGHQRARINGAKYVWISDLNPPPCP
jgi:hypothetical protein